MAAERASTLAAKPLEALKVTKRLLREPIRAEVDAALLREGAEFVKRLDSDEAREAFIAFMNPRASSSPAWGSARGLEVDPEQRRVG